MRCSFCQLLNVSILLAGGGSLQSGWSGSHVGRSLPGHKGEEPLFSRSLSRGVLLLAFYFGPLAQVLSDVQELLLALNQLSFPFPPLEHHSYHFCPSIRRVLLGGSLLRSHISNRVPFSRNSPELDSHPTLLLVFLDFAQQRLPQVPVLDGDTSTLDPAVPDPRPCPLGGAFNDVLGIGGNHQCVEPLAGPVPETQGGDDGAELGSIAGLKSIVAERSLLLQAARGES